MKLAKVGWAGGAISELGSPGALKARLNSTYMGNKKMSAVRIITASRMAVRHV